MCVFDNENLDKRVAGADVIRKFLNNVVSWEPGILFPSGGCDNVRLFYWRVAERRVVILSYIIILVIHKEILPRKKKQINI